MRRNDLTFNLRVNLEATGVSKIKRDLDEVNSRASVLMSQGGASSTLTGLANVTDAAYDRQRIAQENSRASMERAGRLRRDLLARLASENPKVTILPGAFDNYKSIANMEAFGSAVSDVQAHYKASGYSLTETAASKIAHRAILMGDHEMFSYSTSRGINAQRAEARSHLDNLQMSDKAKDKYFAVRAAEQHHYGYQQTLSDVSGDIVRAERSFETEKRAIEKSAFNQQRQLAALEEAATSNYHQTRLRLEKQEAELKELVTRMRLQQSTGSRMVDPTLVLRHDQLVAENLGTRQGLRRLATTQEELLDVQRNFSVLDDAPLETQRYAFTSKVEDHNINTQRRLDSLHDTYKGAVRGHTSAQQMRSLLTSELRGMSQNQLETHLESLVRNRRNLQTLARSRNTPEGEELIGKLLGDIGDGEGDIDEVLGRYQTQEDRLRAALRRSHAPQTFMASMFGAITGGGGSAYGRANNSAFNRLNDRITNFAQMGGLSLYGLGSIGLGTALTKSTIGQASEAESMKNVLAGMVNTYYEFYDLQGKVNDRQMTFEKSLERSEGLYKKIRERAVESILTTQEMFDYVLSGSPLLMRQGLSFDESLDVVDATASLGKAMGYQTPAVMSDIRDLAMGTITTRSQVLRAIGIDREDLEAAKAKGPAALEAYFRETMSGFQGSLERIKETPQGRMSRFQDLMQQSAIKVGDAGMKGFLDGLENLYSQIQRMEENGTLEKAGENMGRFLETLLNFASSVAESPLMQRFIAEPGKGAAVGAAAFIGGHYAFDGFRSRMMNPMTMEEYAEVNRGVRGNRFPRNPGMMEYALFGNLFSDVMGLNRAGQTSRTAGLTTPIAKYLAHELPPVPGVGGQYGPMFRLDKDGQRLTRGHQIGGGLRGIAGGILAAAGVDQFVIPELMPYLSVDPSNLDKATDTYTSSRDALNLSSGLRSLNATSQQRKASSNAVLGNLLLEAGTQAGQLLDDNVQFFGKIGRAFDPAFDNTEQTGFVNVLAAAESMRLSAEKTGNQISTQTPKILGIRDKDAVKYADMFASNPGMLEGILEINKQLGASSFTQGPGGAVGLAGGVAERVARDFLGTTYFSEGAFSGYGTLGKNRNSIISGIESVLKANKGVLSDEDTGHFRKILTLAQAKGDTGLRQLLINDFFLRDENMQVKQDTDAMRALFGQAASMQGLGYGVLSARLSRQAAGLAPGSAQASGLISQQRALGVAQAQNQFLSGISDPNANPTQVMLQFEATMEQVEASYEASMRAILQERQARLENVRALQDQTRLIREQLNIDKQEAELNRTPIRSMEDVLDRMVGVRDLGFARIGLINKERDAQIRNIRGQRSIENIQGMSRSQLERATGASEVGMVDQVINGFTVEFGALQQAFTQQFKLVSEDFGVKSNTFSFALEQNAQQQKALEDAVLKHLNRMDENTKELGILGREVRSLTDAIGLLKGIQSGGNSTTYGDGGIISQSLRSITGRVFNWNGQESPLGATRGLISSASDVLKHSQNRYRSPFGDNVKLRLTSPYGNRTHPVTGRNRPHNGVDLAASQGEPVKAVHDGVITVGNDPDGYGSYVDIRGQGVTTRYAHLSKVYWKSGDRVTAGMDIGASGGVPGTPGAGLSTGGHLHFEMWEGGKRIDPSRYLFGAGGGGQALTINDGGGGIIGKTLGSLQGAFGPKGFLSSSEFTSQASRHGVSLDKIRQYAEKHGVDPNLFAALIYQESRVNPRAKSHAGAMGLTQLMPGTARMLGVTNAYNIDQNLDAGAKYLSQQIKAFGGNLELALAAYNAGPNSIKGGQIPNYSETRKYVPAVLSKYFGIDYKLGQGASQGTGLVSAGDGSAQTQAEIDYAKAQAELQVFRQQEAIRTATMDAMREATGMTSERQALRLRQVELTRGIRGIGSTSEGVERFRETMLARQEGQDYFVRSQLDRHRLAETDFLQSSLHKIISGEADGSISLEKGAEMREKALARYNSRMEYLLNQQIQQEDKSLRAKANLVKTIEKVQEDVALRMGDMARQFEAQFAGIGLYGPDKSLALSKAALNLQRGGIEARRSTLLEDLAEAEQMQLLEPSLENAARVASLRERLGGMNSQLVAIARQDAKIQGRFDYAQTAQGLRFGVRGAQASFALYGAQNQLNDAQRAFGAALSGNYRGTADEMQAMFERQYQNRFAGVDGQVASYEQNLLTQFLKEFKGDAGKANAKFNSPEIRQAVEDMKASLVLEITKAFTQDTASPRRLQAMQRAVMQDRIIGSASSFTGEVLANPMSMFMGGQRSSMISGLIQPYYQEQMGQMASRLTMFGALSTGRSLSQDQLASLGVSRVKTKRGVTYMKDGQEININNLLQTQAGESLASFGGNLLGQWGGRAIGGDGASVDLGTQIGALAGPSVLGGLGLGAFAGPAGAVVGGLLGGLFGRRKSQEDEDERQYRQQQLRLLASMDKSLRTHTDIWRTISNEQLFGTASRYLGGRYNSGLGREMAVTPI